MSSCKSCGNADHSRRSSTKCLNYLPPIRKRQLTTKYDDSKRLEVYVIKRGLNSILCPLLDPVEKSKLLSEIRRDVQDLSRIFIELGIFVNYCIKTSTDQKFDKPDILNYVYALKGKGPYAGKYREISNKSYDGKLRNYIIQELAKTYETILHTNIETHAYSRLCRYFNIKRNDSRIYNSFYKKEFVEDDEISNMCKLINVDTCKKSWWQTIPIWVKIQEELNERENCKSFNLFPQPRHGLKHVTYSSRGWHELLRRVIPHKITSEWPKIEDHLKELWKPWLIDIKNFGCCIQTDGVSVILSINRYVKKKNNKSDEEPPTKRLKTKDDKFYNKIIAVDPGSRIPLATCNDNLKFKRVTKKWVRSHTLEWKRDRVRERILKDHLKVEAKVRENIQSEKGITLTSKSTKNVKEYTEFRLKCLDLMQKPYEDHRKLTRLKFDKYIRTGKTEEKIIKEVFDGGGEAIKILYGAGSTFMNNAEFSGRKFKHDSLLKRLKQRKTTVEIVDEHYTSQACSTCNEKFGKFNKIKMNHRLRWGVCQNCNSEFDRDYNAAKNILINYKRSTICRP